MYLCQSQAGRAGSDPTLQPGVTIRQQIEITQFTLLMALDQVGEIAQGELGEILALDSTSLTRMLKLLRDHGWVRAKAGSDRRMRIFSLTNAGREKFQQSLRHWNRAQNQLRSALGAKTTGQLGGLLAEIARISQAT